MHEVLAFRIYINHTAMTSRDAFECPVCFEPLQKPVFQCRNGHLMCCACVGKIERSRNKACPTCRVALTERIRSLEADRRADKRCRASPYSAAPRASHTVSPVHVFDPVDLSAGLPEVAQLAARKFNANAFSGACQPLVSTDRDGEWPHDTLVEIYTFKISDEVLGFGEERLASSGATYQIQVRSADRTLLADLSNTLDAFPSMRRASPSNAEVFSSADVMSIASNCCVFLYIASLENNTMECAVKLLKRCLLDQSCRVRFHIWKGARETPAAHFYDVPPPFGGGWITLCVKARDVNLIVFFNGGHSMYRERLDAHCVGGVYTSCNRYCRGLEFDASRLSERERAVRVIREVFKGLAMRVYLSSEVLAHNAAFVDELRHLQCLHFD